MLRAQGPDSTATPLDTATAPFTIDTIPVLGTSQVTITLNFESQSIVADSLGRWGTASLDVAHALARLPGVSLRDYGGHGAVQTVSLRGFATNQTTLTINGVPYAQNSAGVVNLGNFYLQGFRAVGVQTYSPASQNPLGGNIGLATFRLAQTANMPLAYTTQLIGGSFGEMGASAGFDFARSYFETPDTLPFWRSQRRRIYISFNVFGIRAKEDFPFHINGESGRRQPTNLSSGQGILSVRYDWEKKNSPWSHTLEYVALPTQKTNDVPGAIVTGNAVQSNEEIQNTSLFHYVRWTAGKGRLRFPSKVVVGAVLRQQYDKIVYQFLSLNTQYLFHDLYANVSATRNWGDRRNLGALVDVNQTQLTSPNLVINNRIENSIARQAANTSLWGNWNLSSNRFQYNASATWRTNYVEGLAPLQNGLARLAIGTWLGKRETGMDNTPPSIIFHLQTQQGHRLPSFNELYYYGYGNENLRPERAQQAEAGLAFVYDADYNDHPTHFLTLLTLRATGFINQTRDKIVAVPLSPVRWSTQQLGRAESHGAEFSLEASLWPTRRLNLAPRAAFTLLQAHDRSLTRGAWLPYTPGHIFNASLEARWRWLAAAVLAQNVGGRFASLQNDRFTYLPPFWVVDAWVQAETRLASVRHRQLRLSFRVSAQNITNTAYVFIQSFPMPPTRWRATFGLSW